jgi:glycosyltransferase involved in cell wall biosynthesis
MIKNMISLVVPLYFGARYVTNILDMAEKNYTFLYEKNTSIQIEVIFVNDAVEKIEYDNKEFDVRLLNNEGNYGVHYSRVKGIKLSRGEYITFWDQDDFFEQEYLYCQMKHIQDKDVSICNGYYREKRMIFSDVPRLDRQWVLEKANLIRSPGQALIRKKAIPSKWMDNIIHTSGADDMYLWSLLAIDKREFIYNDRLLYTHVEDGNNTSFNWEKQAKSIQEMIELMGTDSRFQEGEYSQWRNKWRSTEEKFLQYAHIEMMMDHLMHDCSAGNKIADQFQKGIAIYGLGVIGKKFLKLLDHYGITCRYVIDQGIEENLNLKIEVYHLEDVYPNIETVIVTPVFQFEEIKKMLQKKLSNAAILPLDFVLESIL